ncbi:MAG TPA: SDR family oxidoreductase [Candidatus Nanopelagicaceae bacterium]|nr:SDR family oxidoreductase [Candidatus Nanopelagicaceae bacterium]
MTYHLRDLSEEVVLITGATTGIGEATARQLVELGARVALNARNEQRLQTLTSELGSDNAIYVAGDTAEPGVMRELASMAVAKWGRIDAVVPNAGVGKYGSVLEWSDDEVTEMMRTNYEGTVHAVRAVVPHLIAQKYGDVVIVSSVAGFRGGADESIYAGTKHAQVGFAGGLDRELQPHGIRTTLICPAGTATEFAMGAGRSQGSPVLDTYLRPDDVAFQIITVLRQPRSVRTGIWTLWSAQQPS